MSARDPQQAIYPESKPLGLTVRAGQIRNLAKIGIASTGSDFELGHMEDAFKVLFEVIHRLADELEDRLDAVEPAA